MNRKIKIRIVLLCCISFVLGVISFRSCASDSSKANDSNMSGMTNMAHSHDAPKKKQIWTCSMHPQIRKDAPGHCPICGMELVPVTDDQNDMSDMNMSNMSDTNTMTHSHDTPQKKQMWTCSMHPQIRKDAPGHCPICSMELVPVPDDQNDMSDMNMSNMSDMHTMTHSHDTPQKKQIWTCSMHPQIRKDAPGHCPICGMELVPVTDDQDNAAQSNSSIRLSNEAITLADVETATVRAEIPSKQIRTNGIVKLDETKVYTQTAHFAGRVESLVVNYTGESVRKGQPIAWVYSPELVTAQKELFEARATQNEQPALFKASVEKLQNLKLTRKQIESILQKDEPQEVFPTVSDSDGVVLSKKINMGDHVMPGSPLFVIGDLSVLWVLFDIYENDIASVKVGDTVTFNVYSLPGETFRGKISFIDPTINPTMHVAKARVYVNNSKGKLKPEMLVSGYISALLSPGEKVLVVPKTAVLWTGKRSVVYVKNHSEDRLGELFTMREITLGADLGDKYIVLGGLEEGEDVVEKGAFTVDSASQLNKNSGMMSLD